MTAVPIDFNAVDDLAFAADRGRLHDRSIPAMVARDVGPITELEWLSETRGLPSPYSSSWLSLDGLQTLGRALEKNDAQWICPRSRLSGALRTRFLSGYDSTAWTAFAVAAQKAAKVVGFQGRIAAQLTAAIDELYSNLFEHSESPETGLVVFHAREGRFDFVVADRGIGVLNSLRHSNEYSALNDHGEALQLALRTGVSRYGRDSSHGYGFHGLFVGLANLHGSLRFRSGDHALLIDGRSPSLVSARTAQKAYIPGFFISVTCEAR